MQAFLPVKMINKLKVILLVFIAFASASCHNNAANQIPITDFFNIAAKNYFHISPDGKFISYVKRFNGKQNIFVKSIDDDKERIITSFADFRMRSDYFWTYNNQIILTEFSRQKDQSQLIAIDLKTLQERSLLSFDKRVNFRILNRNSQDPDIINLSMNLRDSSSMDVYRLNTKTGITKMYIKNPGNITDWYTDADGKIRLAKASDGVNETILYRPDDESRFKPIIVNNFKNTVMPIAFTGDKKYFYAQSNVNQDKMALVEINAQNVKDEKILYQSPNADIDEVTYIKNKSRLEMVSWQEDKPKKHFFNAAIKAIYDTIATQLPGNEIKITDRDTAEKNFIVYAYSDVNPGSYYLYKTQTKELIKLADSNPQINSADLCEMKPVSFMASDGLLINGYLTLPKNKPAVNLPVVVIPHSELGRRNNWGYSSDVQFLANRGYAVFLVNYRGSKGYGKTFYSAGFKQVGRKMQQDITDGVKWLIAKGIANHRKIAIFGTNFGGLSALNGVSFNPGLYSCAIVQNGLINLFTYVKDVPPFFKPMLKMRYEIVGNPETDADEFRAISPVFNANKIKAPLLIIQDAKDPRANISEFNQFVSELIKNGVKVTYDRRHITDHHFDRPKPTDKPRGESGYREQDRINTYNELEHFLSTYLQVDK